MRKVHLVDIFNHTITKKYLRRSGIHHAVTTAFHAYNLALQQNVSLDAATKAALLHDLGHYEWYQDGEWDYTQYRKNDIHAIKGAERAHKLLIRLGEDPKLAKEISLAILLHTDSYLPFEIKQMRTPLQDVVAKADEMDEQPKGMHHYKKMDEKTALTKLKVLDDNIDAYINKGSFKEISSL